MMDDATVRQRCEDVFRNATGHPSFIGRDGVDLRDMFAAMIRAAYAEGRRAGMEEAATICEEEALIDDERGYYGKEMAKAIRAKAIE